MLDRIREAIELILRQAIVQQFLAVASIALFVMTMALIFTIATLLLLKALLLERRSDFGQAIGRNNLAMALAYYSVFFGIWIPFLTHPVVKFFVVVVTFITSTAAIRQLSIVYGGWRAMLVEAGEATAELVIGFRRVPAGMYRNIRALFMRFRRGYRKTRRVLVALALFALFVVYVVLVEI